MVGVVGGGRVRRHLPEEAVEKQNTPWLVLHHCISGNEQVINQHELNEKLEALSFKKKKKTHWARTENSLLMQIQVDICCSLYPPNDNLWV